MTGPRVRTPGPVRHVCGALLALVLGVTVTSCTKTADGERSAPAAEPAIKLSSDARLHDLLPDSIKSSGVLRVGTTTVNPPMDFAAPSGEPRGVDPDLARAAGQLLGVKVRFSQSALDGLIPGVLAGRWDVMWPGMNDTPIREKQVTMVDYVRHSFSVAVPAGNPKHVTRTGDFCGLTFGEVQGSVFQELIPTLSRQNCATKGKPAIKVETFPDNAGAFQAVAAGRIDCVLNAQELIAYQAQQSPRLQAVSSIELQPVHYGIGVLPGNKALVEAMRATMDALIQNGTYAQILRKWKLEFMAIPKALVNHPTPG